PSRHLGAFGPFDPKKRRETLDGPPLHKPFQTLVVLGVRDPLERYSFLGPLGCLAEVLAFPLRSSGSTALGPLAHAARQIRGKTSLPKRRSFLLQLEVGPPDILGGRCLAALPIGLPALLARLG